MIILEPWWVQCIGLLSDGSVGEIRLQETGRPFQYTYEIISDLGWKDICGISSSRSHLLGLTKEGTIHTQSGSYVFETSQEWKDIINIKAGYEITVGLTNQGILLYEKNAERRSCASKFRNVRMIAASNRKAYGLCEDGLLFCSDGGKDIVLAEDWGDVIQIAATNDNVFGLSDSGRVRALFHTGYEDVSSWYNMIHISAGNSHLIGLTNENILMSSGDNNYHQCEVSEWRNVNKVFTGCYHTLALVEGGEIVAPCNYWS